MLCRRVAGAVTSQPPIRDMFMCTARTQPSPSGSAYANTPPFLIIAHLTVTFHFAYRVPSPFRFAILTIQQ